MEERVILAACANPPSISAIAGKSKCDKASLNPTISPFNKKSMVYIPVTVGGDMILRPSRPVVGNKGSIYPKISIKIIAHTNAGETIPKYEITLITPSSQESAYLVDSMPSKIPPKTMKSAEILTISRVAGKNSLISTITGRLVIRDLPRSILKAPFSHSTYCCLLYTSDAADDLLCVDLGGRRIIKKKKNKTFRAIT